MFRLTQTVLALFLSLAIPAGGAAGAPEAKLSSADKALLRAGMRRHIDRGLIEERLPHLDPATGKVMTLHPYAAHPAVPRMGPCYVLCSDCRGGQGNTVNAGFHMARRGKAYAVFQMDVGRREGSEKPMKTGKVEMVD